MADVYDCPDCDDGQCYSCTFEWLDAGDLGRDEKPDGKEEPEWDATTEPAL